MFKLIFLIFFAYHQRLVSGQQCNDNKYNPNQQTDSSTCFIWGNYNLKTFDDHGVNFQSKCSFTACQFNVGNKQFKIDFGRKERRDCERTKPGCFTFIKFLYNDVNYHLFLDDNKNPALTIDGKPNMIPYEKNKLRIHRPGIRVIVELLDIGVEIRWDKQFLIQIKIENDKQHEVQGLCGNNNKCSSDDMMLTNKQIARDTSTFVKQYLLDRQACAEVNTQSPCVKDRNRQNKGENKCLAIKDRRFNDAKTLVDPELYYQACIWNYCSSAIVDETQRMCDSLDAYAKATVEAGLTKMISWRRDDLCSKDSTCSAKLDFYPCEPDNGGIQCGETKAVGQVNKKCEEGCYCAPNTFRFGAECFIEKDCPCYFNQKKYNPGDSFPQDCNTCTCVKGKFICTQNTCYAVAIAVGDPHYTTWDGKRFDFMGQCAYYLVKARQFSIAADQFVYSGGQWVKNKSNAPSYMRRIIVKMLGKTIELKPGLAVAVDGVEIRQLPHQVGPILISKPSSLYVLVVLPNKVKVEWDGYSLAKIYLPTTMKTRVRGLFGTYTDDQSDDFQTPTGEIAKDAVSFGNSWKTEDSCQDAPPTPIEHPCVVNPAGKAPAEKICSAIKGDIFKKCQLDDVDTFFDNCVYDACFCKDTPAQCACEIMTAFADGCARKGIVVDWRNKIPECRKPCPEGLVYQECGDPCVRSCEDIAYRPECEPSCIEGCNCAPGTTLNEDGKCIPFDQCKCRKNGVSYPAGYKMLETDDEVQTCTKARWITSNATKEDQKGLKPEYEKDKVCNQQEYSIYTPCMSKQLLTCQNMHEYLKQTVDVCVEGCQCEAGFLVNEVTRNCVLEDECPCYFRGRSYELGSYTVQDDCNKCICNNDGFWDCKQSNCDDLCYKETETKKIDCNTCTCKNSEWSCTNRDCNAETCTPNNKAETRDCNTCTCIDGFWECTNKICECSAAEVKHEGCKTCACENGYWKCDDKDCADRCTEGETAKEGCNTCRCVKGSWECTNNVCPEECQENARKEEGCRVCTCKGGTWECDETNCIICEKENEIMVQQNGKCVCQNGLWKCLDAQCHLWGDSHIKTFDGQKYDFQGECNYNLANGELDGDEFKINFLNERCSNAGATCLKSFTAIARIGGHHEALTFDKDTNLPNMSGLKNFKLTDKVLHVIIDIVGTGIKVFWDRRTWVYVKLDAKWQGKVDGLCGTYNKQEIMLELDMRTPDDKILAYVDSWRLNGDCDLAKPVENYCNNERSKWAQEECSVLLSNVFQPCHDKVPVKTYHDACVMDSCKCDLGGDCECLCTAISMYAQECNNYNIPIAWRTQKLCPMQCVGDTHYEPCVSSCQPKTCETIRNNASIECKDITCTEGCAPKKLKEGHVYTDDSFSSSVLEHVCTEKKCNIYGQIYFEGDVIRRTECDLCLCEGGKEVCVNIYCGTTEKPDLKPHDKVTDPTKITPTEITTKIGGEESPTTQRNPPPNGGEESPTTQRNPPPNGGEESPTTQKNPTPNGGEESPTTQRNPPPNGGEESPTTQRNPPPNGGEESPTTERNPPPKGGTESPTTEQSDSTKSPIIVPTTTPRPDIPCEKVECPTLSCPPFAQAVKLNGQCCPCCQHADKCMINAPSTRKLRLKKPGAVWKDGLCKECTCVGNEKFNRTTLCKTKLCHEVVDKTMKTQDIYYEFSKGPCCPALKPVACVHNKKVYELGEEWNADKCTTMKCAQDRTNNLIIKEVSREYCNENCPAGYVYQNSETSCCGECIRNGCTFQGKSKNVGEKWQSKDSCTSYVCNKIEDRYVIMSQGTICPSLEYCSGDIKMGGCCNYCSTSELFTWQNEPLRCDFKQ